MLGNAGTFDAWLSTLYFGMNLPSSLMRSARTLGMFAGGAAGGPGGAAVGAMAASAGLSAVAERPELGGLNGDALGRRRRRRSPQEQRRVNTTTPGANETRAGRMTRRRSSDVQ